METIDTNVIQLWWHYEEIAMHFNELIIQYRLQVMGGAGIVGTLASYIIGNVKVYKRRHIIRLYVSAIIVLLLCAAAYLDLYYYNVLLQGAVCEIINFEEKYTYLHMSTQIKGMFGEDISCISGVTFWIIGRVYMILIIPLSLLTIWWGYVVHRERIN